MSSRKANVVKIKKPELHRAAKGYILARTETGIACITSLKRGISVRHDLEGWTIIDYVSYYHDDRNLTAQSQLKFSGHSLSEQCVEFFLLPKDIDWSLFNSLCSPLDCCQRRPHPPYPRATEYSTQFNSITYA
ncbi:hypothetical protein NEOLEDRAFT_268792 [Neolentinus lepideus HHB14362 ss-1]|uniref:Uncharacterized protein n=1 Tax=Neolentinus lepideus HHB14362 ss-1 TaxID=1314782 RepID=A0A165T3G9_9AGAM|nr:hypothetical protein NEOLEDRAFT_268792 [Neolentinus lepideus HHB14362 ss-1]